VKALIRAPFAERWLQRLREQLEVVYEPWIESRRILGPDDLAARVRNEGFSILLVEADFMFEPVFAVPGAASLFHSFCTGAEAATAIIGAIGAAEVSVTM